MGAGEANTSRPDDLPWEALPALGTRQALPQAWGLPSSISNSPTSSPLCLPCPPPRAWTSWDSPLIHTSWFPQGYVAQNGAPGAPTLRTASPTPSHPHPQAVPGSSTACPPPPSMCLISLPGLWVIPRSPVAFRAHTEAHPSPSRPPGCAEDLRLPGLGGDLPAQAPQLPRIQAGFASRPSGSR